MSECRERIEKTSTNVNTSRTINTSTITNTNLVSLYTNSIVSEDGYQASAEETDDTTDSMASERLLSQLFYSLVSGYEAGERNVTGIEGNLSLDTEILDETICIIDEVSINPIEGSTTLRAILEEFKSEIHRIIASAFSVASPITFVHSTILGEKTEASRIIIEDSTISNEDTAASIIIIEESIRLSQDPVIQIEDSTLTINDSTIADSESPLNGIPVEMSAAIENGIECEHVSPETMEYRDHANVRTTTRAATNDANIFQSTGNSAILVNCDMTQTAGFNSVSTIDDPSSIRPTLVAVNYFAEESSTVLRNRKLTVQICLLCGSAQPNIKLFNTHFKKKHQKNAYFNLTIN